MVRSKHTNKAFLGPVALAICGIALFTLCTPEYAAAQSDRFERQFQQAVEQKQQFEAEENEKNRKLQLELERMRADRSSRADTRQYYNRTSSSSGSQFYNVSTGDALEGTNASTYQLLNGVILKTSGYFHPVPPTVCIANCN